MFFATAAARPRRFSWLVCWCLGLLTCLALPAGALAQGKAYALGRVFEAGPSLPFHYLTVIDGATNAKGTRVQMGRSTGALYPNRMAMAPDGARIYVVSEDPSSVWVFSTVTESVVDTWPMSLVGSPIGLAVSPDSRFVYLVGSDGLKVVDTSTRTVVAAVSGPRSAIAVSPDGTRIYTTNRTTTVAVHSAQPLALIGTVRLDGTATINSVSVSPNGRFAYLTRSVNQTSPGQVDVLDTVTGAVVATTAVGPLPYFSASSPDGSSVYVTSPRLPGDLHRLSSTTHESTATTTIGPSMGVGFTADSSRAYVAADMNVQVISVATNAIVATVPFLSDSDGKTYDIVTTPPLSPPPTGLPSAPVSLRATVSGSTVSLEWTAPTSGTPTGYVVEGGTAPGQTLASIPTGSTATSFAFDAPTGSFYVRLHATTESGRSPASNEVLIFVNVVQPPSAPTGLLGLANGSDLALSWKTPSEGAAPTSFILDVSGALTTSVPLPLGETFSFTGVPVGTYTFAVRAVNDAGTSAASPPVTLAFPSACPGPPEAPTNFVVSRSGSHLSVSWDPPSAGPAVSMYVLEVTGALNLTLPMSARSASGVVPSGTYNLSVLAMNPCGSGVATAPQSVTLP